MFAIKLILVLSVLLAASRASNSDNDVNECKHFDQLNIYSQQFLISMFFYFVKTFFPDKMCVPHLIFDACEELISSKESKFTKIKCVSARDR